MARTIRGLTPKELASMPPHDTADDCIRIPLGSTKYLNLFTLIDLADLELVSQYQWSPKPARNTFYAGARVWVHGRWQSAPMHQYLMGTIRTRKEIDHINRNGLDNRRANLRICTRSENLQNTAKSYRTGVETSSQFKGVALHKRSLRWRARIHHQGVEHSLGYFDSQEEAARAYDQAAKRLFGAFAYLNFPDEQEEAA